MLNALRYMLDFRRLPEIVTANRSLLWQFVKRSVASRYRGSMLGLFWSFVQPMMMLCVYTFVFSVVFRSRWARTSTAVGEAPSRSSCSAAWRCSTSSPRP